MEMKFPDTAEENRKKVGAKLLQAKSNKTLWANFSILLMVLITAAVQFLVPTEETPHLKEFVLASVFVYLTSTLTYTIRYQVGIDRGKRDEEYIKSVAAFEKIREEAQEISNMEALQEFCIQLQKESLDVCRREMLLPSNIPLSVFMENYMNMKTSDIMKLKISLRTRIMLIRCAHVRVEQISAVDVLSSHGALQSAHMRLLGISGAKKEKRDAAMRSAKALLLTLFTGYFGFRLVDGFSVLLLLQWTVQMVPVLKAFLDGYRQGYANITVTETCYKQNQTEILRMFIRHKKEEHHDRTQDQSDRTGGFYGERGADGDTNPNPANEVL